MNVGVFALVTLALPPVSASASWVSGDSGAITGAGYTLPLEDGFELVPPVADGSRRAVRWVAREVDGEFELSCRVSGTGARASLVLADRAPLELDDTAVTPYVLSLENGSVTLEVPDAGPMLGGASFAPDGSAWLRIASRNQAWTFSSSTDGRNWNSVRDSIPAVAGKKWIGLAVWAEDKDSRATFNQVRLWAADRGDAKRAPLRRDLSVPGRIEAEDFDRGGPNESFHDVSAAQRAVHASLYRTEDVEIESNDVGGFHVEGTRAKEWLEYSVSVSRAGQYTAAIHAASTCCGGRVHIEIDRVDKTGPLRIPITGSDRDKWLKVESAPFALDQGPHVLRLVVDSESEHCPGSAGSIDAIEVARALPSLAKHEAADAVVHPPGGVAEPPAGRLLFDAEHLKSVTDEAARAGSYAASLLAALKQRVDSVAQRSDCASAGDLAACAALGRDAALLFRITGDEHYARAAYSALAQVVQQPSRRGVPFDVFDGVTPATLSERAEQAWLFVLAYDWAKDGWSDVERAVASGRLRRALDNWPCAGSPSLQVPQSPTVAQWSGAELLMLRALGEQERRPERYRHVKQQLLEHVRTYGSAGLSADGLAPTATAGPYVVAAVLALRQSKEMDLEAEFGSRHWWQLLMADGLAMRGEAPIVESQIAWAAALLGVAPVDLQGQYVWFFDRCVGRGAASDAVASRAPSATWWALLFHPGTRVLPTAPSGPLAIADTGIGSVFFHSGSKTADDVRVVVRADAARAAGERGGSGLADAFGLGVFGFGHRFVGEPVVARAPHLFSGLLVDGRAYASPGDTGALDRHELSADGGGYVVIDGDRKYRQLGLTSAKRHVLVDFKSLPGRALIAIFDQLRSSRVHRYSWQLNIGDDVDDDDLVPSAVDRKPARGFAVRAADGAYLEGVTLGPAETDLVADDPVQIMTSAKDVDILAVMVLGRGASPRLVATGSSAAGIVTIGDVGVKYDAKAGRIVVERVPRRASRDK